MAEPYILITNCTNCGAPLELERYQDQLRCNHCDTNHVPSILEDAAIRTLEGVASNVDCSICDTGLLHAKLDEWTFLYCANCKGLLLEQKDLLQMIKYVRSESDNTNRNPEPIDQKAYERIIGCPSCEQRMQTHEYYGPGDFIIDSCLSCEKIWLDGGELSKASTIKWNGSRWR